MELKGFQNWSEYSSAYNNLAPLNWTRKTHDILVAEVLEKLRKALWAWDEEELAPQEEKILRLAADIIIENPKQEAAKKMAERWVFNIFIEKLTTNEKVKTLVNKATKLISWSKDVIDFSEKIYENVQLQLLQNFDGGKLITKELRDEFLQDIPEIYQNIINNTVLHRIQGKNFLNIVKKAFIEEFLSEWKKQIHEAFESDPNIRSLALGQTVKALEKSQSEMERVFPEYFFQMVRKEIHEKYLRKINSSTQKQKNQKSESSEPTTKLELSSIIDEAKEKSLDDKALQDKIQEEVNKLDLPPQEKKQLTNRLFRLKKNKKPLKTSDYLSEENTIIKPQDEGRFLDLIDQLGIEIIREENTSNNEKATTKSETTNAIETKEETAYPQKELESWLQNLETPEEITDHILEQLEKCDYTFTNKEKFRKEVLEFSKQKLHKDLLLWAAIDFQSPEKKSQNIFTIKIWWSARIFLIKQNGEFTVEKFCKNHNEYETYFSFLRKSFD